MFLYLEHLVKLFHPHAQLYIKSFSFCSRFFIKFAINCILRIVCILYIRTCILSKNIGKYGKIKGIYVGGSSAGGYISQMLCFDKTWLSKHEIKPTDIAGFIHDAGQPTCHFNVLHERGLDTRRVIIDESAPLYHVGESEQYPPMLIIVSDNDMQNRYEQTMLLVSTLKHFGHCENVQLKVMNGKHCGYLRRTDENGDSILGKIVTEFIVSQL